MTFSFTTDVAVSPTTFLFHTPSLGKAMWRVLSKIPTANGSVASADMRALSSQRSAEKEQMHSQMLTDSHLQRKTLDMVTIIDTTTVMATMGLTMATMKIMVITGDIIMTMAKITATVITSVIIIIMTMDKVRVIMGFNSKECRKIV